jgi:hypothetical protein
MRRTRVVFAVGSYEGISLGAPRSLAGVALAWAQLRFKFVLCLACARHTDHNALSLARGEDRLVQQVVDVAANTLHLYACVSHRARCDHPTPLRTAFIQIGSASFSFVVATHGMGDAPLLTHAHRLAHNCALPRPPSARPACDVELTSSFLEKEGTSAMQAALPRVPGLVSQPSACSVLLRLMRILISESLG